MIATIVSEQGGASDGSSALLDLGNKAGELDALGIGLRILALILCAAVFYQCWVVNKAIKSLEAALDRNHRDRHGEPRNNKCEHVNLARQFLGFCRDFLGCLGIFDMKRGKTFLRMDQILSGRPICADQFVVDVKQQVPRRLSQIIRRFFLRLCSMLRIHKSNARSND